MKNLNLNPYPPIIRCLIKIHETHSPNRPIVNWKEAPAYKLAKMLTKKLGILIPIPYIFNIKNSIQLVEDLLDILFDKDLKFISFDIENMYSNIPITELTKIIEVMCTQNRLNTEIKDEIIKICNILTKQNYFQYEDLQYITRRWTSHGTSHIILSEIYLQYLENTKIFYILLKHQIIGYFRYLDDILILYKNGVTNMCDMLDAFNKITPTMTFTMEEEVNTSIDLLDISISIDTPKISFNVYRKPTATDIIIPNDSCHPPKQKLAGIRYLVNHLSTYPLGGR